MIYRKMYKNDIVHSVLTHEHDVTMDDELDEGDFDGSDHMGSGDEMDF